MPPKRKSPGAPPVALAGGGQPVTKIEETEKKKRKKSTAAPPKPDATVSANVVTVTDLIQMDPTKLVETVEGDLDRLKGLQRAATSLVNQCKGPIKRIEDAIKANVEAAEAEKAAHLTATGACSECEKEKEALPKGVKMQHLRCKCYPTKPDYPPVRACPACVSTFSNSKCSKCEVILCDGCRNYGFAAECSDCSSEYCIDCKGAELVECDASYSCLSNTFRSPEIGGDGGFSCKQKDKGCGSSCPSCKRVGCSADCLPKDCFCHVCEEEVCEDCADTHFCKMHGETYDVCTNCKSTAENHTVLCNDCEFDCTASSPSSSD